MQRFSLKQTVCLLQGLKPASPAHFRQSCKENILIFRSYKGHLWYHHATAALLSIQIHAEQVCGSDYPYGTQCRYQSRSGLDSGASTRSIPSNRSTSRMLAIRCLMLDSRAKPRPANEVAEPLPLIQHPSSVYPGNSPPRRSYLLLQPMPWLAQSLDAISLC